MSARRAPGPPSGPGRPRAGSARAPGRDAATESAAAVAADAPRRAQAALSAAFEEFDHSRDGYITLEEAIRLLTRRTNFRTPLTYEMAQARWQEWLRMFDADKDGRLSMAEISKHLAGKS